MSRTIIKLFIVELPGLSAHRTLLGEDLRVQPLDDAVHVEAVRAGSPDQWAIVAGQSAFGAAAFEWHPADAAVVVVGDPTPGRHRRPVCEHRSEMMSGMSCVEWLR